MEKIVFLNKFYIIFHFLSIFVFLSIWNIDWSIPLKVRVKHKKKNSTAFIYYSETVYENLEDYNPIKKKKLLIVFDDVIADMEANKRLNPMVVKLFMRGRKPNI